MAVFKYTVLDEKGRQMTGDINAPSASEAAATLRGRNQFVVSVKAAGGAGMGREMNLAALIPVKKKDVTLMLRQLAVLLNSGVSLVQALVIIERQSRGGALGRLVKDMRQTVESGQSLADAMAANSRTFPGHLISVARSADISGELDTVMLHMADLMEKEQEFKRQMVSSMVYPSMVIIMSITAVAILTLVVIPKFIPLLNGKSLPWATQVIMDVSAWVQAHLRALAMGVGGVVFGIPLLRKTEGGGFAADMVFLRIPVIGRIVQCGMVVDFSRNLAAMFASGVPVSQGLLTVRDTLKNQVGARVVNQMNEAVQEGYSMSSVLMRNERVFPPMVGEMVATGEETGEMENVLLLTADIFQKMLESYVKVMNSLIEPVLIIVMGSLVGFVFYALMAGVLAVYGI